jgi:hypothetical protein
MLRASLPKQVDNTFKVTSMISVQHLYKPLIEAAKVLHMVVHPKVFSRFLLFTAFPWLPTGCEQSDFIGITASLFAKMFHAEAMQVLHWENKDKTA